MGFFDRIWAAVEGELFGARSAGDGASTTRMQAQAAAPVIWLVGKTGAGKSSVVSALTGDDRATIGNGFEPCTRSAGFYDFPREAPVVRFLDTRGLEEPGYDPAEDIAWCEGQAHLLLAVASVADPVQGAVVAVLARVRARHPDWPLVVAQTQLHICYEAARAHPPSYAFTGGPEDIQDPRHPHPLRQALAHQRRLFAALPGAPPRFVPVDLTHPEDGFTPASFGIEALEAAIEEAVPAAHEALRRAEAGSEAERIRARARPLIYGYAAAAAGAGAVPVPVVGFGGLGGSIALMLRALAGRYGVAWTPALFAQFTGAIGGGTLVWWGITYGLRELLKLVPLVGTYLGGTLNAASAFAVAVGMGEAACVWLGHVRLGSLPPDEEVRAAFAEGLRRGFRQRRGGDAGAGSRAA